MTNELRDLLLEGAPVAVAALRQIAEKDRYPAEARVAAAEALLRLAVGAEVPCDIQPAGLTWDCPHCGRGTEGARCHQCGETRP